MFAAFGDVFDYILIMNYDTYGGSTTPGPNAPLDSSPSRPACNELSSENSDEEPSTSAKGSVDAWTKRGFPAEKILLGVPSYGYVYNTAATSLAQPTRRRRRSISWSEGSKKAAAERKTKRQTMVFSPLGPGPVFPLNSSLPPVVQQLTKSIPGGASVVLSADDSSQIQFVDLLQKGALRNNTGTSDKSTATPTNSTSGPPSSFEGAGGFVRRWDACSSTPYLTSSSSRQLVSYDDPASLLLKAQYVKQRGIGGVNMFDVHGDTSQWDLVDALRAGLGLSSS